MDKPLVSIVIPTYNRAGYLWRSLYSALRQTYANSEIIVCDNASADVTADVVDGLARRYRHRPVRFIRQPDNIGPVKNWFSGIEAARGEYVKILFSDDYLYEHGVARLVEALAGTSFAFSYGPVHNLWEGSRVTSYGRVRPGRTVTMEDYIGAFFSPDLAWEDYPRSPCAALFRTDTLRRIPLDHYRDSVGCDVVDSGIGPDLLMFLYSFLASGGEAVWVRDRIAAFDGHDASITVASGPDRLDSHNFAALLRFYETLPDECRIGRVLRERFDQLAAKPGFFLMAESRLEMLRRSGCYEPVASEIRLPAGRAALRIARRIRGAAEVRLLRALGPAATGPDGSRMSAEALPGTAHREATRTPEIGEQPSLE